MRIIIKNKYGEPVIDMDAGSIRIDRMDRINIFEIYETEDHKIRIGYAMLEEFALQIIPDGD